MARTISDFLIAIAFVGLFVAFISTIVGVGSSQYGVYYDNATFDGFDYLNQINETTSSLQNQTASITATQSNAFDVVGTLFNQAYTSVQLTFSSIGFFYSLMSTAGSKIGLGGPIVPLIITTLTLVVILTILFIALRPIFKDQQ